MPWWPGLRPRLAEEAYSAFEDPLIGPRGLREEKGTRKRREGKCKEEEKEGERKRGGEWDGCGLQDQLLDPPVFPSAYVILFPRSLPKN